MVKDKHRHESPAEPETGEADQEDEVEQEEEQNATSESPSPHNNPAIQRTQEECLQVIKDTLNTLARQLAVAQADDNMGNADNSEEIDELARKIESQQRVLRLLELQQKADQEERLKELAARPISVEVEGHR